MLFGTEGTEILILKWIQNIFGCPFMDFIMPHITALGDAGFVWIITAVTLLFFKKYKSCGLKMAAALTIGLIVGSMLLKPTIARERPFILCEEVTLLIGAPKDFSFPSGHTLASFISVFVLFSEKKSFGIAALVLGALIAFSRMYLFVHYPSDVAAGIILAFMIYLFTDRVLFRRKEKSGSENI